MDVCCMHRGVGCGIVPWQKGSLVRSAQLSNADALSSYLFGAGKDVRERLPVGRRFEGEVVGGAAAQLRALVAEHGAWLAANCARQVASYRCCPLSFRGNPSMCVPTHAVCTGRAPPVAVAQLRTMGANSA